jgi:hypothetical protein
MQPNDDTDRTSNRSTCHATRRTETEPSTPPNCRGISWKDGVIGGKITTLAL